MKVQFFAGLRRVAGTGEIVVQAGSVRQLLTKLGEIYGRDFTEEVFDRGELRPQIQILVNGRNLVFLNGLDTPLDDDDTVSIFPQVAGGAGGGGGKLAARHNRQQRRRAEWG